MSIHKIIERLIDREGGFSDNPDDLGGPTRYGITQAKAREWGYEGDMRDFPRSTAVGIYKHDFYTGPGFSLVEDISPAIAEELVDTGVNMGAAGRDWPTVWLQEWLNVFNAQGALYDDIAVDGIIGPATISALEAFLSIRGKEGVAVMLTALNCEQGVRYKQLTTARERNETFTYGWLRARVMI